MQFQSHPALTHTLPVSRPQIQNKLGKGVRCFKDGKKEKLETCESLELLDESPRIKRQRKESTQWSLPSKEKIREVRLNYRVEWKN